MKKEELNIWNSVEKTDPAYTKSGKDGGRQVTSINAHYMFKQATELFGPAGKGWGWNILEERFDDGEPISFHPTDSEQWMFSQTHTLKVELWYKDEDEKCSVVQYGHTPYRYKSRKNNYIVVDQEAPKKSLTDALKKCLSMLGFSADIFMGLYDDNNYVQEIGAEFAIEKSEDKNEAAVNERIEFKEELQKLIDQIRDSVSMNMLEKLYVTTIHKVDLRANRDKNTDKYKKRIEEAKNEAMSRLKGESND